MYKTDLILKFCICQQKNFVLVHHKTKSEKGPWVNLYFVLLGKYYRGELTIQGYMKRKFEI